MSSKKRFIIVAGQPNLLPGVPYKRGNSMKRYLFQAAILFMFFLPLPAGTAKAQASPEQWREQMIADFKKWREDIPDYEKRLYDRVKNINKRTVRLMNVVIGGFVLILIVLVVGFLRIFRILEARQPHAGRDIHSG
jgi:hypothetical protein